MPCYQAKDYFNNFIAKLAGTSRDAKASTLCTLRNGSQNTAAWFYTYTSRIDTHSTMCLIWGWLHSMKVSRLLVIAIWAPPSKNNYYPGTDFNHTRQTRSLLLHRSGSMACCINGIKSQTWDCGQQQTMNHIVDIPKFTKADYKYFTKLTKCSQVSVIYSDYSSNETKWISQSKTMLCKIWSVEGCCAAKTTITLVTWKELNYSKNIN